MGPRVVRLVEELSALARSGREEELRRRLELLRGYLSLVAGDEEGLRLLRASLSSPRVFSLLRKSLASESLLWCKPL